MVSGVSEAGLRITGSPRRAPDRFWRVAIAAENSTASPARRCRPLVMHEDARAGRRRDCRSGRDCARPPRRTSGRTRRHRPPAARIRQCLPFSMVMSFASRSASRMISSRPCANLAAHTRLLRGPPGTPHSRHQARPWASSDAGTRNRGDLLLGRGSITSKRALSKTFSICRRSTGRSAVREQIVVGGHLFTPSCRHSAPSPLP